MPGVYSLQVKRDEFVTLFTPLLKDDTDKKNAAVSLEEEIKNAVAANGERSNPWRIVIHPHSKWLKIWDMLHYAIGVYLFLDVPFRISFHAFHCFGPW